MALVLLLLLCGYILAMSSPSFQINWHVPVNSGGGGTASSVTYTTNLTIGQTAIGGAASDSYEVGLGYWPGVVQNTYQLYLPIVVNQ